MNDKKRSASAPQHIALFGGTFSPVHNAHIELALFLHEHVQFDEFFFLPNKAPTLDKTTQASVQDRLTMLTLALSPYPQFKIDTREMVRSTPSFMVDTLSSLRNELNASTAISLILGQDSFYQFHRWHDWQTILTLCNLIVLARPDYTITLPDPLKRAVESHLLKELTNKEALASSSRGGFYRYNAGNYAISSSMIRALIREGRDASAYLPLPVWNYIKEKKLFL